MTNHIYSGEPSLRSALALYLFHPVNLFITFMSGGMWLILIVPLMLIYKFGYSYDIGGNNMDIREGVLSHRNHSVPMYSIKTVDYKQNFMERMFNTGSLIVRDTSDRVHNVYGVDDVRNVASVFKNHVVEYKQSNNNIRIMSS